MRKDPIDYDSPLGISKREWTKVLGVNLALLLIVYVVAAICTAFGCDFFLLKAENADLARIEEQMRSISIFPLIQMAFVTIEETIILMYVMKSKPKWWWVVWHYGLCIGGYFLSKACLGYIIPSIALILGLLSAFIVILIECITKKKKPWKFIARLAIATAITLGINVIIAFFRTRLVNIGVIFENAEVFYLSVEYDLALGLILGFLTLVIPWEKGERSCLTISPLAGGSSPTSKRCSPKNSLKKTNLTPKLRRRIFLLKVKVIVIQTVALAFIAFVPIYAGKGTEFALMYVAFCMTRFILGFNHSLHFKSELMCVTVGGLVFWGLTYLSPDYTVSIIMSLVYGCALALGFRLYWELHDLMMYRKAAKTDRYAMLYTAFKGNLDPRRIKAVMIMRGHSDPHEIKMVQMYMAKEKVDYIAEYTGEPVRSLDRKLTMLSEELYLRR